MELQYEMVNQKRLKWWWRNMRVGNGGTGAKMRFTKKQRELIPETRWSITQGESVMFREDDEGGRFPWNFERFIGVICTYDPYEPLKVSWKPVHTFFKNPEDRHTDRRGNFIEVEFSFSVNSSVRLGGYCTVFRCRWATMYTDWLTEIAVMNIDGRRKNGSGNCSSFVGR